MDILIEFILELILEGSMEIIKIKKVPKYIRYPLLGLIILFFSTVIFGLIILGILSLKENIMFGLSLIILGLIFLISSIFKINKQYNDYKKGDDVCDK